MMAQFPSSSPQQSCILSSFLLPVAYHSADCFSSFQVTHKDLHFFFYVHSLYSRFTVTLPNSWLTMRLLFYGLAETEIVNMWLLLLRLPIGKRG